jgi:hypothetical protein
MRWSLPALTAVFAVLQLMASGCVRSALAAPDTGCQLVAAAFCDSFDNGPSQGGKSGDLDSARWHVSRISPAYQFAGEWSLSSYNEFPAVPVAPCRAGIGAVVPYTDAIVCDAASGHDGELMTAIMAQFYGLYSLRPNQPFDFAGRTGTIVFDVDAATAGSLDKWVSVYITDQPVNGAHSLQHTTGLQPNKGVGVEFAVTCGTGYQQVGVSHIFTYDRHVESTALTGDNGGPCVRTSKGRLNHFEIRLSETQIEIWGSDFSTDRGATDPNFRLLKSAPLELSFTRGYVHFQVGIRQAQHTFPWDNVAFDGPFTYRDYSYDALDANVVNGYGTYNLGQYSFPPQTVSWNVLGLPRPGTITADVVRLMFNVYHQDPPTTLNLTVNGTPRNVAWPYPDRDGWTWRTFAVAIPITDLVEGTSVVTIGADRFIATSNVNIVFVNGVFR